MAKKLPAAFLQKLQAVEGKRSRIVVEHILEHGFITTEDLQDTYGYDHPPRAVRDVKDQGVPIEMFWTKGKHGRRIGAYRFGDPRQIRGSGHAGRKSFPKRFKQLLVNQHDSRCQICLGSYESRYLQIDHRVPYEVGGDLSDDPEPRDHMLICGSCNRAKSWSCEHCKNWAEAKQVKVCKSCYWANPERYAHLALRLVRRLDVMWTGEEVSEYDQLQDMAKHAHIRLPEFVKAVLRKHLGQ